MAAPALAIVMPYASKADVNYALQLATRNALRELRAHPHLRDLYRSGVKYKRDPKRGRAFCEANRGACEPFKSPLEVMRVGHADCDDLAPWLAAQRILEGDKRARARAIDAPGVGYHVIVKRGDGSTEDPSKKLGMGKRPVGTFAPSSKVARRTKAKAKAIEGCACIAGEPSKAERRKARAQLADDLKANRGARAALRVVLKDLMSAPPGKRDRRALAEARKGFRVLKAQRRALLAEREALRRKAKP